MTMNFLKAHFEQTKKYAEKVDPKLIGKWLLECGYFPEQNILPPCFQVSKFDLKDKANFDVSKLTKKDKADLINVAYPKNQVHDRTFSIQNPKYYHDMVYHIISNWDVVLNTLFRKDNLIYSYSFPIPINSLNAQAKIPLRSGRLIYEWLEMAEEDLIADAYRYNYLIKTDITNFYKSIYTHSIAWALHTRKEALEDTAPSKTNKYQLLGNKLDRLMQYANDQKTNCIPIGSALSDLIAEIILSDIDTNISKLLKKEGIDFLASRFKDDYRFLCRSEDDCKKIIKTLSRELDGYNLLISSEKTHTYKLPEGLYREHNREYQSVSLQKNKKIEFKEFELGLLNTIDIHRKYSGTSIIEKFLSELVDKKHNLKVSFKENKEILKMLSMLLFVTKESPKTLCQVLSIFELLFLRYKKIPVIVDKIKEIVKIETESSSKEGSVFSFSWYVFFSKYLALNTKYIVDKSSNFYKNKFVESVHLSEQAFFKEYKEAKLFVNPKESAKQGLSRTLDVFYRQEKEK